MRHVGFLWDSPKAFPDALEAFRSGLRELGYVEGKTIAVEYRYAEGDPERMRAFAEEFVRLKVDAIVAPTSIYTAAAKWATSTIPIIFMSHADPLGTGHVASLAYPGGNATGLSLMMTETNVKLLELFKEAAPCCRVRPGHAFAHAGLEGGRVRRAKTWHSHPSASGQQRQRIRARLCRHGQ
jgi:putative ABC transport system substrate-binding protein